jgi:Rha family phage regulatory protein
LISKNKTIERIDFMLVEIHGKKNEEVLVTSSRMVAEAFGKEHKHVLEAIENIKAENSALTSMFFETSYQAGTGKNYKEYIMNRDGFSLLAMGFTGAEALRWKLKYIQAFNEMETELKRLFEERKQWEIERAKGVVIRHMLTDTIKMKVTDSPHKKFMYPNYTKMIYKTLFGKTMAELQTQYGVKGKESIREYLAADQIKEVESLEMLIISLINCGWGYEQIKSFVQENSVKRIAG